FGALGYWFYNLHLSLKIDTMVDLFQGIDAGVKIVLLVSGAFWFMYSLSTRLTRRGLLKAVQQLREDAHLIDILQNNKDPDRLNRQKGQDTAHSPDLGNTPTPFLLNRYLDYCTELLSLIGKVTALYASSLSDPVILAEIDQVEELVNDYRLIIGTKMTS